MKYDFCSDQEISREAPKATFSPSVCRGKLADLFLPWGSNRKTISTILTEMRPANTSARRESDLC
jgi:hypothetical protein